jgi:hypothetical protein
MPNMRAPSNFNKRNGFQASKARQTEKIDLEFRFNSKRFVRIRNEKSDILKRDLTDQVRHVFDPIAAYFL